MKEMKLADEIVRFSKELEASIDIKSSSRLDSLTDRVMDMFWRGGNGFENGIREIELTAKSMLTVASQMRRLKSTYDFSTETDEGQEREEFVRLLKQI